MKSLARRLNPRAWLAWLLYSLSECPWMRPPLEVPPEIKKLVADPSGFELAISHPWFVEFAGMLAEMYAEFGGPNYLATSLWHPTRGFFEILVKPRHGKMPSELKVEADNARDEAQRQAQLWQDRFNLAETALRLVADEAEDHRARYDVQAANDYWRGRRDEADHFRDRLNRVLAGLNRIRPKSLVD